MFTLTYAEIIIATLVAITTTAGITYYLVTLRGNAELNCNEMYADTTGIGMDPAMAKSMISDYASTHIATDSCSAWFSLQSIQKFACMIANNANNNCQITDPTTLGIRIYFAKYPAAVPKNSTDNKLNDCIIKYGGKITLVMVPTYSCVSPVDGSTINKDFDPSQSVAAGGNWDMASIYSGGSLPASVFVMNHGSMIPPPMPVASGNEAMMQIDFNNQCGAYFLNL